MAEGEKAEPGKEDADDNSPCERLEIDESSSQSDGTRPKGVLVIHSKLKIRTKKSVQWKATEELNMIHYFELDETERGAVMPLLACLEPAAGIITTYSIPIFKYS